MYQSRYNPRFGGGMRLHEDHARAIAEAIWPYQGEMMDHLKMEKEGALSQIIERETGRKINGEKNLNLIREILFDM